MAEPTWPTNVNRQRLIKNSRTDTPNGYDFEQSVGIQFGNGVETIWHTKGTVRKYGWGHEQVLDMSVENMPPHMRLADVPQHVERKFFRGKRRGERFEATVEHKYVFADGRMETEKEVMVFDEDIDKLVDMPNEEATERLNAVFDKGESMNQFKPGKRLI